MAHNVTDVTRLLEAAHSGDRQAAAFDTSPSTADRQWAYARAWLRRAMSSGAGSGDPRGDG